VTRAVEVITSGVALADPDTWEIVYENARFTEWLPPVEGAVSDLAGRLAGVDLDKLRSRLARRRSFRHETEVSTSGRAISVQIELRHEDVEGESVLVVECRNISKRKEAEYMLDSYSRMVEKKTRELEKERDRVEKLLLNVMPRSVYEELKEYGTTAPQLFDPVSVLLLDFVGFTEMAISREPASA
jgi:hypothetical protein